MTDAEKIAFQNGFIVGSMARNGIFPSDLNTYQKLYSNGYKVVAPQYRTRTAIPLEEIPIKQLIGYRVPAPQYRIYSTV